MERVLFLNELSAFDEVVQPHVARELVLNLLSVVRSVRRHCGTIGLNCAQKLVDHPLDPEKTLKQVLQGDNFRDEWRFLKTLVNRSPFGDGILLTSDPDRIDYTFEGHRALGLGWAHMMDSLSISFDSRECWQVHEVALTREMLNDDASVTVDTVVARNASRPEHVEHWLDWLSVTSDLSGLRPSDVWDSRTDYFPNLKLLDRVEGDLLRLHQSGVAYGAALSLLQTLDSDMRKWQGQGVPTFSTKVTPEGETRRRLCMFPDAAGQLVCFDLHARFTGGIAGRLHFCLDSDTSRAIVAYIGPKLTAPI